MDMVMQESSIAFILCMILFSWWSYRKHSVSLSGAIAMMVIIVVLVFIDEWQLIVAMGAMFISSSLLTRWRKDVKSRATDRIIEHHPRTAKQAFANLGVAFLLALTSFLFKMPEWMLMAFGAVAAANADTWASEIGMLSRSQPRYILSRRQVQPGLSGGVTALGVFAALLGAAFIAGIDFLFTQNMKSGALVLCAGFIGSLVDSVLGELMQVKYESKSGFVSELESQDATITGVRWMDNDFVNLVCSASGAICVYLSQLLL